MVKNNDVHKIWDACVSSFNLLFPSIKQHNFILDSFCQMMFDFLAIVLYVLADVNECFIANGGCSQACVDTDGSYHCGCQLGYTMSADEHTCFPSTLVSPLYNQHRNLITTTS